MAFTEDLDQFFDTTNGFAETVTIDGNPVDVIIDPAYIEAAGGIIGIESGSIFMLAPTSKVSAFGQGASVVRGSDTFSVQEVRRDMPDPGITTLVLRE